VAQIAKSIATRLNATNAFLSQNPIDVDLIEVAGLAHDLGHPPFGHNGEEALDECMKDSGGFEGNAQTFRILTRLEKKDQTSPTGVAPTAAQNDGRLGLNLAYRTLAATLKYDRIIPRRREKRRKVTKGIYHDDAPIFHEVKAAVCPAYSKNGQFKTIECWIMDVADDIAYSTYDLEDTFKAGFLSPLEILASQQILLTRVAAKVRDATGLKFSERDVIYVFWELFKGLFPEDLAAASSSKLPSWYLSSVHAAASSELASNGYLRTKFTADLVSEFIAGVEVRINRRDPSMSHVYLQPDTLLKVETLKHYTFEATIMSPRLRVVERRGFDLITKLFGELNSKKGNLLLPNDFRARHEMARTREDRKRIMSDFIAGMTDRYAVEFYGRIFSNDPESIFKPF